MSKIIYRIFLAILFLNISSFSQVLNKTSTGSLGDFEFGNFYSGSKDFIELSYGIGEINNEKILTQFNNLSLSEVIIGRRYQKPAAQYTLIEFSDNYLYSSFVDDYKQNINDNTKLSFDIWRFGFGYRKGYGYNLGSMAILPFYHIGIGWNKTNINAPSVENTIISVDDFLKIKNYDDEIKFGTSSIGGVDLQFSRVISLGASYETAVIFPYYKTWKQIGSFFVETISQTGLDFLTEGVLIRAVPSITPILYFVLKNGLSYYLFTLKKEKMYWPFEATAPLAFETFKFSLKITL